LSQIGAKLFCFLAAADRLGGLIAGLRRNSFRPICLKLFCFLAAAERLASLDLPFLGQGRIDRLKLQRHSDGLEERGGRRSV
jgi:hypothetical protein